MSATGSVKQFTALQNGAVLQSSSAQLQSLSPEHGSELIALSHDPTIKNVLQLGIICLPGDLFYNKLFMYLKSLFFHSHGEWQLIVLEALLFLNWFVKACHINNKKNSWSWVIKTLWSYNIPPLNVVMCFDVLINN